VAQLLFEAGDSVSVSCEPRFEVASARSQLPLEIAAAADELRLDLFVALDELGTGLHLERLARLVRGLAILQGLLQLRDARLRGSRGGFGPGYLIIECTSTLLGDVAFRDSELECLLNLDQPLAFACQALFDVA